MKMSFHHLVFALIWLLISCFSCRAVIQCIREEKEALLEFKQGITADICGYLTSWVGEIDCCQWHGILCDNRTNGVIEIHLRGQDFREGACWMTGNISSSLVELKHLKYLDLSFNDFLRKPIPSFIGSIPSLEYLNLSNSNFGGEIPHQLSNLSSLTSLDLTDNEDFLPLKSLGWLSRLTLLRYIGLSYVNMSEAIDWMQVVLNLPLLESLKMDHCNLSSSIPNSSLVYTNSSTTLRVLSLSDNHIDNSEIIQWTFNNSAWGSSNLVYLDLSLNGMNGIIPSFIWSMHSLSHLDLSYNSLGGLFSKQLSNLKSLIRLDLSNNNFVTSELSIIILSLSQSCVHKSLVYLDLSSNNLWGSIPNEIATFSSLRTLKLSANQLNGTISPSLGQLSKLEWLDLANNSLEGTLSNQHLSNLSRLNYLRLSYNSRLRVDIDANWVPPFQLNHISLASCKLDPCFPKWVLTQRNFSWFDISNTGISDVVPLSFWNSLPSNLVHMNISNNDLQGEVPNVGIAFGEGLVMDLSSNKFQGALPSFLVNATILKLNGNRFSQAASFLCPKIVARLTYLDLSDNVLTGELPNCWGYFVNLEILHLDNNHLSGNLPVSVGLLTTLKALHLRNNNISGKLPLAFQNCTSLTVLDLSYNSLIGNIPDWIGNHFSSLLVLSLRSNKFHGGIPLSLCELSKLQLIDLSFNNLFGFIPNCVNNLTAMIKPVDTSLFVMATFTGFKVYNSAWIMWKRKESIFWKNLGNVAAIDISNNKLEGPIPEQVSSLDGLVFLNFSRNRLNGSITPRIGQLKKLEFLDLSNNQLCGEIPTSLSSVCSLGLLDLSNNNLSGRIPTGTQLQSFDASSYMGNQRLCGDPLPKCLGDQPPAKIPKEDNITHEQESDHDDDFFLGFIISVILGFIVGFWGVCGTLVIKRSWRIAYFRFVEDIKDRIHVMVVVNIARAWRKN